MSAIEEVRSPPDGVLRRWIYSPPWPGEQHVMRQRWEELGKANEFTAKKASSWWAYHRKDWFNRRSDGQRRQISRERVQRYWTAAFCLNDLLPSDTCWVCGSVFENECETHRAHLVPHRANGIDCAWNLVITCPDCNDVVEVPAETEAGERARRVAELPLVKHAVKSESWPLWSPDGERDLSSFGGLALWRGLLRSLFRSALSHSGFGSWRTPFYTAKQLQREACFVAEFNGREDASYIWREAWPSPKLFQAWADKWSQAILPGMDDAGLKLLQELGRARFAEDCRSASVRAHEAGRCFLSPTEFFDQNVDLGEWA